MKNGPIEHLVDPSLLMKILISIILPIIKEIDLKMANGRGKVDLLTSIEWASYRSRPRLELKFSSIDDYKNLVFVLRPEGKFVVDGFSPFDIIQGTTGDCWFMSAISALAEKRPLVDRVINTTTNSSAAAQEGGIYKFQFYRMGEWHDVIIDDQIPMRYSAKPENGELWVPLLEKAYAKFLGNYHNIVSGVPLWALFNLTGGLTVDVKEFKG